MKRFWLPVLLAAMTLSACAGPALPFQQPDPSILPIEQAYNALMDNYVDHPSSSSLLQAGYQGAMQVLTDAGIRDVELRPPQWSQSSSKDWSGFLSAYGQITNKYAAKVHSDTLEYNVIRQMASSLKDCQTNYFDPTAYRDRKAQLSGSQQFGGVGVILKDIPGHPTVLRVLDGPAQKAGLKPGDEIVAVDGKTASGETFATLRDSVRGPQGSKVRITVQRIGVAEPLSFEVTRDQVQAPVIDAAVIGGTTGYIHIYSFPPSLLAQLDNAINIFQQRGVRSVVIDLRANTGGDQQTIVAAVGRFVNGGTVEIQVDRSGQRTPYNTDPSVYWKQPKPVAILVDDGTVSGGEIFAKALQEAGAGPVIGSKTQGCVSTGRTFELKDGSALDISTAKVLSGKGTEINRVGVTPDLLVNFPVRDLAAGTDPQLLAAFQRLQGTVKVEGSTASVPAPAFAPAASSS